MSVHTRHCGRLLQMICGIVSSVSIPRANRASRATYKCASVAGHSKMPASCKLTMNFHSGAPLQQCPTQQMNVAHSLSPCAHDLARPPVPKNRCHPTHQRAVKVNFEVVDLADQPATSDRISQLAPARLCCMHSSGRTTCSAIFVSRV